MTVRIDGTNSTANPAITGADTDTGLQLGTNEIQFVTGGTNRATVESDGNLTIEDGNLVLAQNHGIHFHNYDAGATIDSNLLDDYEEGTWTPTISGCTVTDTLATNGEYRKVGTVVTCIIDLQQIEWTDGGSHFQIGGLPFTSGSTRTMVGNIGWYYFINNLEDAAVVNGYIGAGTSSIAYYQSRSGSTWITCNTATTTTNGYALGFFTYHAA